MKKIYRNTLLLPFIFLVSCTEGINETVESAYMLPVPEEPQYKFSRNGGSSVDLSECQYLHEPIEYIYSIYLKEGIGNSFSEERARFYYEEGQSGKKPKNEIAKSILYAPYREDVLKRIQALFDSSIYIGKFENKNREAEKGITGYVGNNISDKNIYFVDEKGLSVAEVFKYTMMGAIYLDKILNIHLNENIWEDERLRIEHENVALLPGKNYTELEHHWDLAYGYYQFWQPLVQAEGLPILKDSQQNLSRAFACGRIALKDFHYDEMKKYIQIIRKDLSQAIAIRIMNYLIGENTIVNLRERPQYAFSFLSQAYGLIYAVQFTRNPDGTPYFTHEEIKNILDSLMKGDGFWDKERMLEGSEMNGSLKNIASKIGTPFGISLNEIKK